VKNPPLNRCQCGRDFTLPRPTPSARPLRSRTKATPRPGWRPPSSETGSGRAVPGRGDVKCEAPNDRDSVARRPGKRRQIAAHEKPREDQAKRRPEISDARIERGAAGRGLGWLARAARRRRTQRSVISTRWIRPIIRRADSGSPSAPLGRERDSSIRVIRGGFRWAGAAKAAAPRSLRAQSPNRWSSVIWSSSA